MIGASRGPPRTVCVTATGGTTTSAHPAARSLPTLRLDYFTDTGGRLADSLDPALVASSFGADTIALVNANLVHVLPNGKVAPDLATWTVSRNQLVYTFTIRRNARFSNGHPVTAADAAFSLERSLAPTTGGPLGRPVPPQALLYDNLIQGALGYQAGKVKTLTGVNVLSKRVLQITNTCVGNQGAGPFTFVCRDKSSHVRSFYSGATPTYTLVPNRYYYGRKAHIRIELPAYAESYKRYLAGTIDDTINIPSGYLKRWKGKSSQYHDYPFGIPYLDTGDNTIRYNAIANMLRAIGMNAEAKKPSRDAWPQIVSQALDKTNTPIVASGWTQDYPDPQDYCTLILRSGRDNNIGRWNNAQYDRLVDKADRILNRKQRAQHIALSQGAMISEDYALNLFLIKPYVHGIIGSEALGLSPRNNDWANVSVSKH